MRIVTGLVIGLIGVILIIGIYSCQRNTSNNSASDSSKFRTNSVKDNPYKELREQAINITAEQLQLKLDSQDELYGIIMDWNMGNAIVTVVSFKTGDASIYLSTGQAFIGGNGHESINKAVKDFMKLGQNYVIKANVPKSMEPTKENKVDFYFLTSSGRYYLEENLEYIENHKSYLTQLFEAGNKVITEYRLINENK